jgi:hypothetical protein
MLLSKTRDLLLSGVSEIDPSRLILARVLKKNGMTRGRGGRIHSGIRSLVVDTCKGLKEELDKVPKGIKLSKSRSLIADTSKSLKVARDKVRGVYVSCVHDSPLTTDHSPLTTRNSFKPHPRPPPP